MLSSNLCSNLSDIMPCCTNHYHISMSLLTKFPDETSPHTTYTLFPKEVTTGPFPELYSWTDGSKLSPPVVDLLNKIPVSPVHTTNTLSSNAEIPGTTALAEPILSMGSKLTPPSVDLAYNISEFPDELSSHIT